ncbi:DMT family transporter [Burkholderia thailandensis]|uniref:Membrane protein, putative n=1 Tax=Burkholderia thailandensis (strain ATCC 700388 / DSM 13276 / CCUG 48851 / CIP 106301 / E264) TaxID=271848 RepID=Q2SYT4_BURTA|nr:EamA family transporter [Burkholderia thailandensis]ABC38440.1 membrane protein, putative [Burkholderia thailandensis E264]AHI74196.1 eamA-like transporter family protein [Burkholderia thailandensis 2002721723]AHI77676.1 eamA-like transporter family protein [Burkholderia thailandensis E444]AIC86135.1 eamA-like transporter family protein [Burkholderia thailandensis USAMRU Malaysia \
METNGRLDGRALGAIGIALLTWSSSYAAIAYCLGAFTPSEIAFSRLLVASISFAVLWVVKRFALPAARDLPRIAIFGILGLTVYHLCLAYAETRIPSGTAAILIALSPGATALLSAIWLRESIGMIKAAGFMIALAGVALVVVTSGQGLRMEPAALWVLVSVAGLAIYSVGLKPILSRVGSLGVTAAAFAAATVAAAPFGAPHLAAAIGDASHARLAALAWLGIAPTFVGYIAWNFALRRAPASQVTSFLYLSPPLSILISWVWLGEQPLLITLLGGGITLIGVALVNARGKIGKTAGVQPSRRGA